MKILKKLKYKAYNYRGFKPIPYLKTCGCAASKIFGHRLKIT